MPEGELEVNLFLSPETMERHGIGEAAADHPPKQGKLASWPDA